ncbi:MAG: DnaJ domain-containing protein [Bacteroidales bacterium]|nr:DnaJ domain-containing protein [Bacteroidales bacterium]
MTRSQAAQILGISPSATEGVIKRAFRKKALLLHPDHNKTIEARSQFIEAHEAYEYLIDIITGKISEKTIYQTAKNESHTSSSKFRSQHHKHRQYTKPYSNMSREEFESRYEKARKAADANLERESIIIYKTALHEYQNSWRKSLAKIMAFVGITLAVLFVLDFFNGTIEQKIALSEIEIFTDYYEGNISYDIKFRAHKYHLPEELNYIYNSQIKKREFVINGVLYLISKDKTPADFIANDIIYSFNQTTIFKDITSITLRAKGIDEQIDNYTSAYGSFPFIPILLLLPLISFWFEKPTFNFVFFSVNYNIYIFPILVIFLMFHDGRLLRLFGL